MTNALPIQGASSNVWGQLLNSWLLVAHNADGTLQPSAVSALLPTLLAALLAPDADQTPALEHGLLSTAPGALPLFAAIANRNTARVDIPVIGDSITSGRGSTTFAGTWVQQANRAIRTAYPTTVNGVAGGFGFIPIQQSDGSATYPFPFIQTGTVGAFDCGPIRACSFAGAGWSATWTAPAGTTSVRIMYYDTSTSGTFSWKVGAGGTTNISNAGSLLDTLSAPIAITSGQVLTIANVSGSVAIDGIVHFAGDENSGITFHNCGRSGWCAGTETTVGWNVPEQYALNWAQVYASAFPNLAALAIMLGTNDSIATVGNRTAAQFQSDLTALIATLRGAATALAAVPLLVIATYGHQATYADAGGWAAYTAAMRAAAAADGNALVIDLSYRFSFGASGPLQYDTFHPSNAGAALIGEIVTAGLGIA